MCVSLLPLGRAMMPPHGRTDHDDKVALPADLSRPVEHRVVSSPDSRHHMISRLGEERTCGIEPDFTFRHVSHAGPGTTVQSDLT